MALSIAKKEQDIPKDAVKLTKDQALKYQLLLVQKWEPSSEV